MNPDRQLHFTIGPVQGFVSQARRTRDFWTGSFILSWLAGVAMASIVRGGGSIVIPASDPSVLDAITVGTDNPPAHGVLPNRFVAALAAAQDPAVIERDVRDAWSALADHVWAEDLGPLFGDESTTRRIWDRQVAGLWEIAWVITEATHQSAALDQRKNWRTHRPPDEPGVKCMVMDGWQELSGAAAPGHDAGAFWKSIREKVRTAKSDLREGEYLCAPAWIKRRFARHFDGLKSATRSGLNLKGWPVKTGVPSVSYIAAARWLAGVIEHEPDETQSRLHDAARTLTEEYGEWATNLRCVRNALEARQRTGRTNVPLGKLDGQVFYEDALRNRRLYEPEIAENMLDALARISRARGKPPEFYAVLAMDGDGLGAKLSLRGAPGEISKALAGFTKDAPGIVDKHSGVVVYAGGDDLVALLGAQDALACAAEVRKKYVEVFQPVREDFRSTISAAILYVHLKRPLTRVMTDAHRLLEDVAKERTGRDAVAVAVVKPGGMHLEWSKKWDDALDRSTGRFEIESLADHVSLSDQAASSAGQTAGKSPLLTSGFLFKLREHADLFAPGPDNQPALPDADIKDVLAYWWLKSGAADNADRDARPVAYAVADQILRQSRTIPVAAGRRDGRRLPTTLSMDAALLARFVASNRRGGSSA